MIHASAEAFLGELGIFKRMQYSQPTYTAIRASDCPLEQVNLRPNIINGLVGKKEGMPIENAALYVSAAQLIHAAWFSNAWPHFWSFPVLRRSALARRPEAQHRTIPACAQRPHGNNRARTNPHPCVWCNVRTIVI